MIHVVKQEFIHSFKSIRSILIILFMTVVSYQSASFIQENDTFIQQAIGMNEDESALYTVVIVLLIGFFGFLFVFATSHDVINKEIEMGTMRLLVTKVSRIEVLTGKLIGTMLFWIVTMSISFAALTMIAGSWFPKDYMQSLVFIFYIVSFVLLISTLIPKSTLSMFLGIIFGITLPIVGLTATIIDRWYLSPFKYVLPYHYLDGPIFLMIIPLGISCIYILIAIYLLQRKDV
ncbi:MAG TPA: ABC transporter permease subunit [Pseudogracilibacillus sp.]|nr:ABC transporter permease subunit [Pseudogracilibacillus sp.]